MSRWVCKTCVRKPQVGDAYCPDCCGFIPFDRAVGSDLPRYTGTETTWTRSQGTGQSVAEAVRKVVAVNA